MAEYQYLPGHVMNILSSRWRHRPLGELQSGNQVFRDSFALEYTSRSCFLAKLCNSKECCSLILFPVISLLTTLYYEGLKPQTICHTLSADYLSFFT